MKRFLQEVASAAAETPRIFFAPLRGALMAVAMECKFQGAFSEKANHQGDLST